MRILTFEPWSDATPQSAVLFHHLYGAFMGTADNPNRAKSLEETRQALKVLDALDAVSDVRHAGTQNEMRVLKAEGGTMEVTPEGHALLTRAAEAQAASAPFALARVAVQVLDLLEHAPTA